MLRDFKFLRRNSTKNDEPENIPVNRKDFPAVRAPSDPCRPPLNSIQDPAHNPNPEQDGSGRSRVDKTPSKAKGKALDNNIPALPLRTPPEKIGAAASAKNRFGWKNESSGAATSGDDFGNCSAQVSGRYGGIGSMTPRAARAVGRGPAPAPAPAPSFSECNSTQSTPTKSVSKPPSSITRGKVDSVIGARGGNFGALYKGSTTVVNSVEVPHFDLKEDPSFWMEHNVQVLIRVRPLNTMERSTNGYNRCLKQDGAQTITWIGHPETRFRFDHVACETVDQEMLFRMACLPMVENCLAGYNSCMFAYGQTGSGKTYTMLGEIDNLELKPSIHRGMTPRIFEFLFARIQAEEESRRDEKLKYNCKCSFLEIYNEQITDLLDPSSTNLLLREDSKQGVYVENLSEFEVHTVSDILNLLTQGSSNRRVAATNMNRESSRSHSVFTCVIESRWEKDSTTNLRFARLNLVDLAGSERQKSSGAEGERLKEAANINKSLSTLGHVIMVLVDVAQGKPRHIPYRDSRLTFLLQDSLGGNSKTMIIANVSPSICSAAETLNTLKFAQRAKMIQNNAVVNEDSTGDVAALQHQIRLLKEELAILKRQNVSRSLTFGYQNVEDSLSEHVCDMDVEDDDDGFLKKESTSSVRMSNKQLKCLETTLAGTLRREQMAESSKKQLEAEIEQLDRLVRQREEDTRSSKMMLRFREDKIQRMESVVSGAISTESYLLEENRALSEEIQLLKAKLDRNPEVTRFAHENIRLLEQLRRYQDFYEEGEKEILLTEVSNLRDQLLQSLDGSSKQHDNPNFNFDPEEFARINKKNDSLQLELKNTCIELEECRRNLNSCLNENEKLSRELEDLRTMFMNLKSSPLNQGDDFEIRMSVQMEEMESKHECAMTENAEEIVNLQLELDILKIILKEERSSSAKMEDRVICLNGELELATNEVSVICKHYEDAKRELEGARSIVDALEAQQILTINEMEDLRKSNHRHMKLLSKQEATIKSLKEKRATRVLTDSSPSKCTENDASLWQEKVKRMQCSLENAKRLNMLYQNDHEFQVSNDEEMDEVRKQAEAETAEVIVCLEEELVILQQEVQDRHFREVEMKNNLVGLETELLEAQEKFSHLMNENQCLSGKLDEKDRELGNLSDEWSLLTSEIEEVLVGGCESLTDASNQLQHISSSFSQKRIWVSEHFGRMARALSEKELLIEELRGCLEDANNTRSDVENMLKSLRGATLAITEAHQRESSEKEKNIMALKSQLSEKMSVVEVLENKIKLLEDEIVKASDCAVVAFVVVNRLVEVNQRNLDLLNHQSLQLAESEESNTTKSFLLLEQAATVEAAEKQIKCLRAEIGEIEGVCADLRNKVSEEQERACALEEKLQDVDEKNISMAKEKVAELQSGVLLLKSCIDTFADSEEQITTATPHQEDEDKKLAEDSGTVMSKSSHDIGNRVSSDLCNRDDTILLVRREIETALQSLKEVQVEMEKLREANNQMSKSEQQTRESARCVTAQVLNLQAVIDNFECQSQLKIEAANQRLEAFKQIVLEAYSHHHEMKELQVELENLRKDNNQMSESEKQAKESMRCLTVQVLNLQATIDNFESQSQLKMEVANQRLEAFEQIVLEACSRSIEMKELQVEMEKLLEDYNKMSEAEKNTSENMRRLTAQVLSLQATMDNFECQSQLKMEAAGQKLEKLEQIVVEARAHSHEMKEVLELEVDDAKLVAAQNAAEAACVLSKFEEAQDTIKEADIMINGLVIENERMKLEMKKVKKTNRALVNEKSILGSEFQNLHSINNLKSQQCEQLFSSLVETQSSVAELESIIAEVQTALEENFTLIASDFQTIKLQLFDSSKLVRTWLEDIWSEIIVKDGAVSVLHLCHMGVMLETVMGLNAENGLLQHGLCESNAVIANLRAHNNKSIKELEMCRVIKGKLLADIKRGFDRISKKEQENQELTTKLTAFDGKISDLQTQEELMLQRSNYMGSQLALLTKELDLSNRNLAATLVDQQKVLESQGDYLMIKWCVKEFESLIFASELEEMRAQKANAEREQAIYVAIVENLKKDLVLFMVDSDLKDQFSSIDKVEVSRQLSLLDQRNRDLKQDVIVMETRLEELKNELKRKGAELTRMISLEKENEMLRINIDHLKEENISVLQNLQAKTFDVESSLDCLNVFKKENNSLRDEVVGLQTCISSLQTVLEVKSLELRGIQESQFAITEELCLKSRELEAYGSGIQEVNEENLLLREELSSLKKSIEKCFNSLDEKLFYSLSKEGFSSTDKMLQDISETVAAKTEEFMDQLDQLVCGAKELESENSSLRAELLRKDEVLEGLQFDLSLLQESASKTKDQKDEIEDMIASLRALEDELSVKTIEIEEAASTRENLEVQLRDKTERILGLESELSTENRENLELRNKLEEALVWKCSAVEELAEAKRVKESLEAELLEMGNAIDRRNSLIEKLRSDVCELECEKDELVEEMTNLKDRLEAEQARAEESEALTKEAQQMAELKNIYAEEKEAEVKLLERSVEELECTINVLEDKANFIQGEAERQRLMNEELELELHTVKQQLHNVQNADSDRKRYLEDYENNLQEAHKKIQVLERNIAEKDKEIAQFKAHISELNLHAEAQANEYKQKFKALEAMAENVKPDGHFFHALNSSSPKKPEKFATRPRGSGSPFKCIGLGISQQIKSERDEELAASRLRIEELESLAASRQTEIFSLNARLAIADSMTHDVMRDLLGVKLDMTACASMVDDQQVQEITEKVRLHNLESEELEQEVVRLRKQLTEFIKERQGWLEEIDRKQAEVIAAQISLERLRQHEQLLKSENEILKVESVNHKQRVLELEGEVKKLSGHQNLHQRIHHHAKIKEENNQLKLQNDELNSKHRRSEAMLARIKEELAFYRASTGRNSVIDFDEEKRLSTKLKETEQEKVQLAQKLLGLCTSVLKAAGITKPVTEISPSVAVEALEQLTNKVATMDRELQDLKYKNKITNERMRLSELMPQTSATNSRADENRQTPKRLSQASYFSPLDR